MTLLRHAWLNLWRNRKRTGITLAAIALNTAILVAAYSLMDGLFQRAVSYATDLIVGEGQVHAPGYRKDRSVYKSIESPETVLARAEKEGIGAVARSYVYGLASTGSKSAGALFWGVDPARERRVFDLAGHVDQGSFLGDKATGRIVLGRKLANSLHARIGSEIVVILQAADGSLGNDLYTVAGILKASGEGFDRSAAILHIDDLQEIAVLGGRIHEIALNTRGKRTPGEIGEAIAPALGGAEFRTWRDILPTLSDMVNLSGVAMWIFGAIFMLAGALGVMNTMLMATYERFREFGILKAIGTTPARIMRDVAAEALVLVLVSTALGAAIGLAGAWYLKVVGIDTSSWGPTLSAAGVAFDPVWRAAISFGGVAGPVVIMWVVCVAAALYPASIAARLDPAEAIQKG
ncbi:MAG: FtsX-like permease family protein [Candidatus Eisenbacteria bacterium]